MYGLIYLLLNKINNKVYIGQTVQSFDDRMGCYKRLECKGQTKIYHAIKKHGWQNFEKIILDIGYNKEDLDELEKFYIDKFQSVEFGYNLQFGGAAGMPSQESKNKMSKSKLGIPLDKNRRDKLIQASGEANKRRMIKIICNQSNQIFTSITWAADSMELNQGHISEHLKNPNKRKHVSGYTFNYV